MYLTEYGLLLYPCVEGRGAEFATVDEEIFAIGIHARMTQTWGGEQASHGHEGTNDSARGAVWGR